MGVPILGFLGAMLVFSWYFLKRYHHRSIAHLPGPPSESWLVGNIASYHRAEQAGNADFEWTRKYGIALRTKGCFGEDVLYLADPKAFHHILNKRVYSYKKPNEVRLRVLPVMGRGLVWAEGTLHSRQRRIMNSAFSYSALKGFLPLFLDIARRTSDSWEAELLQHGRQSAVLDVSSRLGKTTLDAIGEAAFGYKFNSITGEETELFKSYRNLFPDAYYMMTNFTIAFRRFLGYLPLQVSRLLFYLPKKDFRRLNHNMAICRNVAKEIVDRQRNACVASKQGGKDVMSIFIQANATEDPEHRLEEDEILSQITLMFAGHETTASTLSWTLYELSRHPDVQSKLREEIKTARANVVNRGGTDPTISDLEAMKYTVAVMKESLRYHPIALRLYRQANCDDVIPLQTPQQTVSGEYATVVPVSKGQVVQLSLVAYNRLKSIWGEDADQWRPERFLEDAPSKEKIGVGVTSNLMSFSSGNRNCIGWRFSPAADIQIMPVPAGTLLQPMVKGQESKGAQMPLTVTLLGR